MPDVRTALLVDYGGVLTTSVTRSFRAFCRELGLPPDLAKEAFVEAYTAHDGDGPVHRMETGEISVEEFSVGLAQVLTERSGVAVPADGLIGRLFALMEHDETMFTAVAAAKRHGVRTGLLSNSWGSDAYPRERFADLFDDVVISGEVRLRKPDPAIFRLAADRLGVAPDACVFVDDLDANITAAENLGMAGVLHRDASTTVAAVAPLLGLEPSQLVE
ncbi:MAG TPA: HAD family phosphatase [Egibacteraceae bacterium]|nr:HAD family phosphatase [Egibacteraceae bacterium]